MKLYGSLTSPYVRKVRALIHEKRLDCEFIVQGPGDPGSLVPALNPLGKVPVLVRDDREPVFDSVVIAEYLDTLGPEPLLPLAGEARFRVQRYHALAQGIMDAVVARMLELRRTPACQDAGFVAKQESKVAAAIGFAARQLRGSTYLIDDRFTLADLALGVALEYVDFRYPHDWRGANTSLTHWLAGISARPSFTDTRPPGMDRAVDSLR
jgi:glutathione S-transferase